MKTAIIILALMLIACVAYAQSTASQVLLGYQTVVNGQIVWSPYTVANPMPTSSN